MNYLGKNLLERGLERTDEYKRIVSGSEKEYVWAEAGVVPYKLCDFHFDCTNTGLSILS